MPDLAAKPSSGLEPEAGSRTDAMSFLVAAGLIFVIPVASDPTMRSARAGLFESDGRR